MRSDLASPAQTSSIKRPCNLSPIPQGVYDAILHPANTRVTSSLSIPQTMGYLAGYGISLLYILTGLMCCTCVGHKALPHMLNSLTSKLVD